jgi:NTP pyrophosphatase (non-canonical NTP hydrolase)
MTGKMKRGKNGPIRTARQLVAQAGLKHQLSIYYPVTARERRELLGPITDKKLILSTMAANACRLNTLASVIHGNCVNSGWWSNPDGTKKDRNVGELISLMHAELSEALEGHRKDMMDEHLPHRKAFEVELADAIFRILDVAGAHQLDIGGALLEKLWYNQHREDHKPEARAAKGGKKY